MPTAQQSAEVYAGDAHALAGAVQRLTRLVTDLGPVLNRECPGCGSRCWRVGDDVTGVRVECRSCGELRVIDRPIHDPRGDDHGSPDPLEPVLRPDQPPLPDGPALR